MYKKILIPYDGSVYSARAAEKAMELASLSGAKVIFVNASVLPSFVYSYKETVNSAISEAVQELINLSGDIASKALDSLILQCKKKGLSASYVHEVGDAVEVILKVAESEGVDLIVMGSKGLSGLSKLKAFGSVARKVTEHSRHPVLLVR
jgi:nucleotide-binding universal stress UspA family protein